MRSVPILNPANGFGRSIAPMAATQSAGGGVLIETAQQLDDYMRSQSSLSAAGIAVTPEKSMRVPAFYAGVRILCGPIANLPLDIKRRVDDRTRVDASDTDVWRILRRKPNRWQTPAQFRRMMQAHVLLRGNGYALITRSRGQLLDLTPMHPDRVKPRQNADMTLTYVYTRPDGHQVELPQSRVFHLVGLTLDGFTGLSVLSFLRETLGESLAMSDHGATMFRNGARVSGVLTHPGKLGGEGVANLRSSLDEFRAEGERAGKALILEEGMKFEQVALKAVDAQWIEARKFSRGDIAMFLGVPPHMLGDTEKSTSWGSGIEQQSIGFVTYTLEDWLTMWEETIARDLIADPDSDLYARFNRSALVRGDIKTRWEAYAKGRRMKVYSANDVRALEDMNPVEGGDVYENPEITVPTDQKDDPDEPAAAA